MPAGFENAKSLSLDELRNTIGIRVRSERIKLELSQQDFANRCLVPLRTYKRFENGECDSLDVFLRIVTAFDRLTGLELLFPPKQVVAAPRTPLEILTRLSQRG
jgi:transcriptional regulator with XRE-family HTH domain